MSRQRDFDKGYYQIRVKGHLDTTWQSWFEGMTFTAEETAGSPPTTLITGFIQDQAALHGILERIRDLNLQLLMVSRVEPA
jgi:hypothetical protein